MPADEKTHTLCHSEWNTECAVAESIFEILQLGRVL